MVAGHLCPALVSERELEEPGKDVEMTCDLSLSWGISLPNWVSVVWFSHPDEEVALSSIFWKWLSRGSRNPAEGDREPPGSLDRPLRQPALGPENSPPPGAGPWGGQL